ncbi:MAG: tRNA pseudouridine(38-40) synthase TruA [Chitinophagaceae bacterium]|nr:tRNA pseudouridine(38-40) synthase TruA [Chitinophagaceae bacterium]
MSRYFLEVAYKGTNYSGFQSQVNANSIQNEIDKAFSILQGEKTKMTCSSRTDAGVHALQNYLHFDYDGVIHPEFVYKVNSILPPDIVVKAVIPVADNSHSRFDATARYYKYYIYQNKNPFFKDRAFYFPYKLDIERMQEAAHILCEYQDFTSFSKRNTQAKTFICTLKESSWVIKKDILIYNVKADRFLRGMVRALTATMLMVGRKKISIQDFKVIIEGRDCTKAFFAVPPQGLFLISINFPQEYFSM